MTISRSSDDSEIRLREALKNLHSTIFNVDGSLRLEYGEYTDCPVCSSKSSKIYCVKDNFRHVECCGCGMVYLNPRLNKSATLAFYNSSANEIYNEQKFHATTEGKSPDDKINATNLKIMAAYYAQSDSARRPLTGRKLLEIGCATGYFLKQAKDLGAEVYGVELNKVNADIARRSVGSVIYDEDIFELSLASESFDIVYMRDVIEHIHIPLPFLSELSRLLRPGGMLFIETHNIDGLIHRLVRGKHTCVFGFEHPVHWSPKTLKIALSKSGIIVDKTFFKSLDLNALTILSYFRASTWTTVYPWKSDALTTFLLRVVSIPFRIPYFNYLLSAPLALSARILGAGSTMKVIGFKSCDPASRVYD